MSSSKINTMRMFSLSKNNFYKLSILIYLLYSLYGVYMISKIQTRNVVYELFIVALILYFSLILPLKNIYKKRNPTLINWFSFTTFLVVIINYLKIIDKFDKGIEWGYDTLFVDKQTILICLFTVLVSLIILNLIDNFFKISKLKMSKVNQNRIDYSLKNHGFYYYFSISISLLYFYLIVYGGKGYSVEYETNNNEIDLGFIIRFIEIFNIFSITTFSYLLFIKKNVSKILKIIFSINVIVLLAAGLISGMKESSITIIVTIMIPYLLSGKIINKKILIICIIGIVLVFPINANYRYLLNNTKVESKITAIALAAKMTLESGSISDIFLSGTENYSSRISLFPCFAYAVQNEERWQEYKNMNRYAYLPFTLVPRLILVDKPIDNMGVKFNYFISGVSNNSQTPTTFGWAYLEGGISYVVLIFFIFALFIKKLELFFSSDKGLLSVVFYTYMAVLFLKVENDPYVIITQLIQYLLILFLMNKIFLKIEYAN